MKPSWPGHLDSKVAWAGRYLKHISTFRQAAGKPYSLLPPFFDLASVAADLRVPARYDSLHRQPFCYFSVICIVVTSLKHCVSRTVEQSICKEDECE